VTVPALTLTQPLPALVEAGVVSMLTRSSACPPELIGGRLRLHAGSTFRSMGEAGGWAWGWIGSVPKMWTVGNVPYVEHVLTLGAVVASCVVEDCVPITSGHGYPDRARARIADYPHDGPLAHQQGGLWLTGSFRADGGYDVCTRTRIEDQRPFGDFSPGNFAWILSDVEPTSRRCPHCWGTTLLVPDESYDLHAERCPTCDGRGTCAPVPMRGRPGLWYPKWEDDRADRRRDVIWYPTEKDWTQ